MEETLPLFLTPIAVITVSIDERGLRKVLSVFIAAVLISYVLSLLAATYHYFYSVPPWGRASDFFFHVQFTNGLFSIHPTYYSLMGCLAGLFSFFAMRGWKAVAVIVVITLFIFLLNARITLILHAILTVSYALIELHKKFSWKALVVIPVLSAALYFLGLLISSIYDYPHRKIDFSPLTLVERSYAPDVSESDGGTVLRLTIWRHAWSVVKENPVWGVGLGNEKEALKREYAHSNQFLYENSNVYNSHNQILSYLICFGVVGFILKAYPLATFLFAALTQRKWVYVAFLLALFVSSLTESILQRFWGLALFSFFNVLLVLKHLDTDE